MQAKNKHTGAIYFWIGFLIPTLLAGIGFFLIGVWPAGDGTVLIKEKRHYAPMTEEQIGTRFLSVASDTCAKEFADRIYETILSLHYVRSI